MATAEPRPLTAELVVDAPPAAVWRVVSDVRRTGEWSPECVAVMPLGRLRRGALLFGRNRRGRVRWATVSRVVEYDEGHRLAWRVLTNRSVWSYTLTATDGAAGGATGGGTLVTQERRTPRGQGRFAAWFTRRLLDGQRAHDDELEADMAAGLATIGRLAQALTQNPTQSGAEASARLR